MAPFINILAFVYETKLA